MEVSGFLCRFVFGYHTIKSGENMKIFDAFSNNMIVCNLHMFHYIDH